MNCSSNRSERKLKCLGVDWPIPEIEMDHEENKKQYAVLLNNK